MFIALALVTPAHATEAAWALLREGGQVILLRHAIVNGTIEPANFDIDKCSTQRNLSSRGKQQARKIGALVAARAAPIERILSSRYCRALETAAIAFDDNEAEKFAPLDLLSSDPAKAEEQNAAVMKTIREFTGPGNLVLVTHLDNIVALTGKKARDGEAVIVRDDGEKLQILGRIIFN